MLSEIRFAGRSLRRRPGFAAVVVCTLAWGSARIEPAALSLFSCCYEQSLCSIRLVFSRKKVAWSNLSKLAIRTSNFEC